MADITLNANAPTPNPYNTTHGNRVTILNSTGSDTTLTSDPGLFNPNPPSPGTPIANGTQVTLTVGSTSGDYYYTVPGGAQSTRSGTIDIS